MGHFTRTPVGRENELPSDVGVGAYIHAGVDAGASVVVDVVDCPTKLSLILIFGFLCRSSIF